MGIRRRIIDVGRKACSVLPLGVALLALSAACSDDGTRAGADEPALITTSVAPSTAISSTSTADPTPTPTTTTTTTTTLVDLRAVCRSTEYEFDLPSGFVGSSGWPRDESCGFVFPVDAVPAESITPEGVAAGCDCPPPWIRIRVGDGAILTSQYLQGHASDLGVGQPPDAIDLAAIRSGEPYASEDGRYDVELFESPIGSGVRVTVDQTAGIPLEEGGLPVTSIYIIDLENSHIRGFVEGPDFELAKTTPEYVEHLYDEGNQALASIFSNLRST